MFDSLPERPDVDQLRRRAKELRAGVRRGDAEALQRLRRHYPSAAPAAVSLAAAQLVIARELGFSSWPRLKAAIAADAASRRAVSAFVTASVEGRARQAVDLLRADPGMVSRSLLAAAVFGDAEAVRRMLAVDPTSAMAIDDERGWPPLLYACYSRLPKLDPGRAAGMAEVVRILLDSGASPNTNDGARYPRSALKGAVEANNPDITRVLLDAGANPNAGQPIGEAMGRGDHRCLELLLSHGARVAGTWAVGSAVYHDDPHAVTLLAEALRAGGAQAEQTVTDELAEAAANASIDVVSALLAAGADPNARDEQGVSALRLAVRTGRDQTAALLAERGAADDRTDIDRFIGACRRADRRAVEQLLAEHRDLRDRLTDVDRAAICQAAASAPAPALRLMLEQGFSSDVRRFGEQPLHTAAYHGNAEAVRVLLDAGAGVDARDDRFDSTPLTFATVGSGERAGQPGNWIETVQLLVDAGASRDGVWISGKPPSEEVIDVLRSYGIRPDVEPEPHQEPDGLDEVALSAGTGVIADIARHVHAAYASFDLELLGSLLHPDVRWSGECNTSAEVLDWYRRFMADATRATVESVEVDRDAVVIAIRVVGQAEGARPATAERAYQVFTVEDAQIVEIRGYPDRLSALARTLGGEA